MTDNKCNNFVSTIFIRHEYSYDLGFPRLVWVTYRNLTLMSECGSNDRDMYDFYSRILDTAQLV